MHKSYNENIEFLKTCDTGVIADALARFHLDNFSIDLPKPLNVGERFAGPAVTISYRKDTPEEEPMDFWTVVDNYVNEGDVLVVGDAKDILVTGDVMAKYAKRGGACAILTDGTTRDVSAIKGINMPLFCMGYTTCVSKGGDDFFHPNAPVEMFGVTINPGDVLVGDEDGVVVIPKDLVDDVVYEAEEIALMEEEYDVAFEKNDDVLDVIKRIGKLKNKMRDER